MRIFLIFLSCANMLLSPHPKKMIVFISLSLLLLYTSLFPKEKKEKEVEEDLGGVGEGKQ